jgi:hypothetical protein
VSSVWMQGRFGELGCRGSSITLFGDIEEADNTKRSIAIPSPGSASLFRGLYARVAHNLGIDPSYVSRVARGERRSEIIEDAIRRETDKVLASIKNHSRGSAKQRSTKKRTHVKK